MSRCIGCGSIIQCNNSNQIGYVPEAMLIEKGTNVYCKRCYEIRNHNIKYTARNNLYDYYAKIKKIKNEKALVLLLIDIMDICGGFLPKLEECIGENKVIIIVNKTDLLPKDMKTTEFENMIKKFARKSRLNVETILFGSVKKETFVKRIISKITKIKYPVKDKPFIHKRKVRFNNCYVIGHASVGKSTLMNQIGKIYLEHKTDIITTNSQFQTTLDFIKWPLDNESFLIDTPGIINPHNFGAYLESDSVNILMPKNYIKPKTFQLNPDQTIFLGGLARIDFSGDEKINASFYVSNELYLHRTKTSNASKILELHYAKLLVPPFTQKEIEKIHNTKLVTFEIKKPCNLFISGIGFIHLVSKNAKISVTIFDMIDVEMIHDDD